MRSFAFDRWDDGRLRVNAQFAGVLRENQLTSFASLMEFTGGQVAKNLLRERTTTRFVLSDADGSRSAFYIKRHQAPPWKEYVKPLLRLTLPILGARNEWGAMLRFHAAGIATMCPVAIGESAGRSFVVTRAIDGCEKLSDWMEAHLGNNGIRDDEATARIVEEVARIARTMHSSRMHHQDFYLTHLLRPTDNGNRPIHVIDLGRARRWRGPSWRWKVKDLAQLNYSARLFSDSDRRRFLETYLGRRLQRADNAFIRRIRRKTERIAHHSAKNRL